MISAIAKVNTIVLKLKGSSQATQQLLILCYFALAKSFKQNLREN